MSFRYLVDKYNYYSLLLLDEYICYFLNKNHACLIRRGSDLIEIMILHSSPEKNIIFKSDLTHNKPYNSNYWHTDYSSGNPCCHTYKSRQAKGQQNNDKGIPTGISAIQY